MFERAEFSLSRAGVMVGLCALAFLTAGLLSKSPASLQNFSTSHYSEKKFNLKQTILSHIAPNDNLALKYPSAMPTTCLNSPDKLQKWNRSVEMLNTQLVQLYEDQFLRTPYSLNSHGLFADPKMKDFSCKDIFAALDALIRQGRYQDKHFWYSLIWRERTPKSLLRDNQSDQWVTLSKSQVTSRSPWGGLLGCVFWTQASSAKPVFVGSARNPETEFCLHEAQLQDKSDAPKTFSSNVQLPSLSLIYQSMAAWRQPQHINYPFLSEQPHMAKVRTEDVPVGLHTQLSFDPQWQNSLQNLLSCYTNTSSEYCAKTKGESRYENARVRMAGLVVLDVPTGAVLAAASADSPCALHDASRKGVIPAGCPLVPEDSIYRPRWPKEMDNHALFTQAQPGSLVKPLLMSAILQTGGHYTGLDSALQRSESQLFLSAWLCRKSLTSGLFDAECARPELTQGIASAWGWNHHCSPKLSYAMSRFCGQRDMLIGLDMTDNMGIHPVLPFLSGHTLVTRKEFSDDQKAYVDMQWPGSMPSPQERLQCAQSGPLGYTRCKGAKLGLISEGYGQGNTLTTPLGMAGLLANLANTAYSHSLNSPHIVMRLFRNDTYPLQWLSHDHETDKQSLLPIKSEMALKVIDAMKLTHQKTGTAYVACTGVWDAKTCDSDLGIAGKTGTPGDADERSLLQLNQDMLNRHKCLSNHESNCEVRYPLPRPRYRWYGALFKQASTDSFDKVVVVLIQSNWRKSDGRFVDDQNAAAEIGLSAIKLLRSTKDSLEAH